MVTILIIAMVAVAVFLLFYLPAYKVFRVAVGADVDKDRVMQTNAEEPPVPEGEEISPERQNRAWLREQAFDEQWLTGRDGVQLFGRILRSEKPTHRWAVICHGFTGNGLKMGSAARHFHESGYHVLLPDLRGCGQSGGDYYGMGWLDSYDMLGWFARIIGKDPQAQIVITGGSMGGATTMMTTGLDVPENLVAAVEDCGYTSVFDEFTYQLKKVFDLPKFPFMYIANEMARRRAGYSFKEADSRTRLAQSDTPTLFIHGTADEFVPFYMMEQCYDAATCEKEKLVVEGAGHGLASELEPELYWSTVDRFLEKHMQ